MSRATEKDLIADIAVKQRFTQSVIKQACHEIQEIVRDGLVRDGVVTISQFGSFRLKAVAARRGVNPKTGDALTIAAHQRVIFTPSKALRELIEPHHQPPIPLTPESPSVPALSGVEIPVAETANSIASMMETDEVAIVPAALTPQNADTAIGKAEEKADAFAMETRATPDPLQQEGHHEIDLGIFEPENESERRSNGLWGRVALLLMVALIAFLLMRRGWMDETSLPPEELASLPKAIATQSALPVGEQQTKKAEVFQPSVSTDKGIYFNARQHHTAGGDTLWSLAEYYYHEPLLWPHIFQANRELISDPDQIRIGAELLIPALEGTPDVLSDEDQKSIAKGYRLLYAFYKAQNHTDAFYALLMAKHYEQGVI